jgi:hypothetical protein
VINVTHFVISVPRLEMSLGENSTAEKTLTREEPIRGMLFQNRLATIAPVCQDVDKFRERQGRPVFGAGAKYMHNVNPLGV